MKIVKTKEAQKIHSVKSEIIADKTWAAYQEAKKAYQKAKKICQKAYEDLEEAKTNSELSGNSEHF